MSADDNMMTPLLAAYARRDVNRALEYVAPEMYEALRKMVGAFDTPIARRLIDDPIAREARESARAVLRTIATAISEIQERNPEGLRAAARP